MSAATQDPTGWRALPLSLKVLVVLMGLWGLGSVANLPNLMNNGVPFFGATVFNAGAAVMALFFDILAPVIFLVGLWRRKPWAPVWAAVYIGVFVLNGVFAVFTSAGQISAVQALVPCAVSLLFLAVIFWNRAHFTRA